MSVVLREGEHEMANLPRCHFGHCVNIEVCQYSSLNILDTLCYVLDCGCYDEQ